MSHVPNQSRPRPPNGAQNVAPSGGNFHKPAHKPRANTAVPSIQPYSTEDAARIQKQLNRVLGPEYVSCRPGGGGQNVSYIEGWKALNLANEIFGFNGWSSELISVQVDYLDSHGSGRVSLGLSVVVRITIRDGTFHEDFGYGNIDNAKNKAMAFEKCKKEAFTDALKRCLRCFGNVLGNCLYDKGIVAKMQKVKLPPFELDWDDFHRDPLIVKREVDRQRKAEETAEHLLTDSTAYKTETPSFAVGQANGAPASTVNEQHLNIGQKSTNRTSIAKEGPDTNQNPEASSDVPDGATAQNAHKSSRTSEVISGNERPTNEARNGLTPSLMKELNAFDDSFVFSDDIPADEEMMETVSKQESAEPQIPENPNDTPVGLLSTANADRGSPAADPLGPPAPSDPLGTVDKGPENMPGQVFFTSSKKALDVQTGTYQKEVPVYDHRFISTGVKRTVDPSKSTKIRRADLPSVYSPSQINASQARSPVPGANIGKRPLGMPLGSRQPSKRLHKDETIEKENGMDAA